MIRKAQMHPVTAYSIMLCSNVCSTYTGGLILRHINAYACLILGFILLRSAFIRNNAAVVKPN